MAKRISRKLLVGLGSTVTFSGIAVVSGFGVKSILDTTLNNNVNQLAINTVTEDLFSNAPDYNVAKSDMFIDPSNLKRFHFGNTLIGQTVTPYGWLGVFDDPYNGNNVASTRIALTGWNGEILWVNEPSYGPGDRRNYNVYDMEYDFKNDLIFVLRTWSSNGFLNNGDENFPSIRLDILDAKTGKTYDGSSIRWQTESGAHSLKKWQEKALNALKSSSYLNWGNSQNRDQSKNLYQLDLASSFDQKNLLLTWMPDFMRLTKNFGKSNASTITLKDFIQLWSKVAVSWIMLPENIKDNRPAEYSTYFNLLLSDQINTYDDGLLKIVINGNPIPADQFYLIANPFFTVGKDPGGSSFYIMHILFSDKDGNIYHKIIGWDEKKTTTNANGALYKPEKYDKIQKIDWKEKVFGEGGGLLVEPGKKGNLPSWTKRERYTDKLVINANTRINKNMFDNNSIVFAYPYGIGTHLKRTWFPIFNVAQMYVEPITGFFYGAKDAGNDVKKIARQFYFGRDIEQKNTEVSHYPGQNGKNNVNQTYNRLITVSPFDNTFIYAEKPNIKHPFFNQGTNDREQKWAGFFIGKVFRNSNDVVRPFFIWNAPSSEGGSTSSLIDSNMTSFEKLYEDGFTFDLRSFQTSGNNVGLNLYFNQNGNPNGTINPNGFKARKIGILSDIFSKIDNKNINNLLWIGNKSLATQQTITNAPQFYNLTGTQILSTSFSTINHSRADLEKWYPRTFFNSNTPSNLLRADSLLNKSSNENTRAVPNKFNSKLSGQDFDSDKSIDMVSGWENNQANYNRLVVKRPEIKIRNETLENKLPIKTTYSFSNDSFIQDNIWINSLSNDYKNKLVFQTQQDLSAASYQIFSSWKDQVRLASMGTTTGNFTAAENPNFSSQPKWYDIRQKNAVTNPFGKVNNNLDVNNKKPLRMLLQISKPSGALPTWFTQLDSNLFNKYPLKKDAVTGETAFEDVLKKFVEEKTKKINLTENAASIAVGLGNLRIDAFMDINPATISSGSFKIYKNGTKKRMVVQNSNGLRIIYEDNYTDPWHQIYDQSQTRYTEFNKGGFGTAVKAEVQTSWVSIPSTTTKLKVSVNAQNFQDTLVRKSSTEKKIFSFEYASNRDLIIKPVDSNWLRSRLLNFQRLINMTPRFEYWTEESQNWATLTTLNDARMEQIWSTGQSTFTIPASSVRDTITKLRLRLIPNDNVSNTTDPNSFVEFSNYSETDPKFLSDPQEIGTQRIVVDKTWIADQMLANATSSLTNINQNDITNFEERVLNNITDLKNRAQVKLVYKFENSQFNLSAKELADKILEKFNNFNGADQGVFALWNGTNGTKLISAKFELKNPSGNFELITANNNKPQEPDLSNDVKSNIKSKIDLDDYISELQARPISAEVGSQPGNIKPGSIVIPGKSGQSGTGRFNGKSFNEINDILKTQKISIKFKQQGINGGAWSSNWLDLNQMQTYATSNPQIQIGFVFESTKPENIELISGNTSLTNGSVYTLKLNLPKIVKLPTNIQQVIDAYNGKPFGGNTFSLSVDNTKLEQSQQQVLTILKQSSQGNGNINDYAGLNDVLEFTYKLGDSEFLDVQGLKNYLQSQSNDQNSNVLKMKVNIKNINGRDPEFALDQALATKEFDLLVNDNTTIKKWLHGKNFETELNKNNISVTGSKSNLTYNLLNDLSKFDKKTGKYTNQQLILQYQLIDSKNNVVQSWRDGYMPSSVDANINKIQVKIVRDKSIPNDQQIYLYGPEEQTTPAQAISTIDLSQIATLITINPNWFNEIPLSTTRIDTQNLNTKTIQNWEEKIYQKIPELKVDPSLKNKLIIKYEFVRHQDLTASTLLNAINNIELVNYEYNQHHGIVKLYDKNAPNPDQSGYKIKATFEKAKANDLTIQFVNDSGNPIDGPDNKNERTGVVDTTNITTTINLSEWILNLMTNLTVVKTTQAGQIPSNGLIPPELSGAPNSKLFASQKFKDIETWLNAAQVNFWWRKEESGNSWKQGTSAITEYDATKKKLWFAIDNQSTNLILTLGNGKPLLNPKADNKNNPIEIKLNAPAVIDVRPSQLNVISTNFSGNTKDFKVNTTEIKKQLDLIKQGLGTGFEDAPLTIMVKVGNEAFYDYKNVSAELAKLSDDVANGIVVVKFAIDSSAQNKDQFQIKQGGEDEQTVINDNGTIKVYINDKNIFNDLGQPDLTGSTSANLKINWNNKKIQVNNTTGVINATEITNTNKPRGVGLRVEFTYKTGFTGDESETIDSNPFNGWSKITPTTFDPNISTKLLMRIRLVNDKYTYAKINQKITIDLNNIPTIINLNADWLKQSIVDQKITIEQFSKTQLQAYETKVWDAAKLGPADRQNVAIEYTFDNKNYRDLDVLINAIKDYKNNHSNDLSVGILQLWNQSAGEKISTKFVKANNAGNYELNITGDNNYDLDFSKVITTVDLSEIKKWLESIKVTNTLKPGSTNEISSISIPAVNAANDKFFNGKDWDKVEKALSSFGVQTQYRSALPGQGTEDAWGNTTNAVNKYDPNIGKFEIRFKLDGNKSKNIKVNIDSNQWDGDQADVKTSVIQVKLKIKLVLQLDPKIIAKFTSDPDAVKGNTKELVINKNLADQIVREILQQNSAINNEFNNVNLKITYKLGEGNDNESWLEADPFQAKLLSAQNDQITNQIVFRFEIDTNQSNDFEVDGSVRILSAKETPSATTKIKYFVNKRNWENNADKILITGTNNSLNWNFNSFNQSPVSVNEKQDGTVNLRTEAGDALQLQFTIKPGANYNDTDVSDDVNNLNNQWVTKKPTKIPASVNQIKVRIVAIPGFIYEPTKLTDNQKARIHTITPTITTEIKVDKIWFKENSLVASSLDISSLTEQMIKDWEAKIYDKIKKTNSIDDQIAREIKIKYTIDGDTNKYNSLDFINKITQLRQDYTNTDLGILQLWNNTSAKGKKIHALFESGNNKYVLKVDNVSGTPTENDLKDQVNTDNIYTTISMIQYIETLKNVKTTVDLDPTNQPGKITNFNPPTGNNPNGIFNNKTYNEIAQRLQAVGIKIEFSKDNKDPWLLKDQVKEYNIQKNSLYLRFTVQSENIKLQIEKNTQISNGQNSGALEIRLPLQVPKYIVIDNSKQYWDLTKQFAFSGTTKDLKFNKNKIDEFVLEIKKDNAVNGNDNSYNSAPLEIQFQVGTGSQFIEISQLNAYLEKQSDDLPDRVVKFKFALRKDANPDEWKIQNEGEYSLLADKDPKNQIKVFINDKGVYNDLLTMEIRGTNDSLEWNWPELVKPPVLDVNTGILDPDQVANKNFGKGLKFEFTFNPNPQNASAGQDPEINWVPKVPTEYDANKGFTHVYLRIKLTDDNYYTYDNVNKPIKLSLEKVGEKIVLKSVWLDKQFNDGNGLSLDELTIDKINEYEKQVKETAKNDGIHESLLSKFKVKFFFNFKNNLDESQLVDSAGLLQKIKEYELDKNQESLGILQLWNKNAGIKIVAKFVDADDSDKYQIEVNGNPFQELNTSNVITTIDFSNMIIWLTTTNKLVKVKGDKDNAEFTIPVSQANDQIFNGKTWDQIINALNLFGIMTEYRHVLDLNQGPDQNWVSQLSSVTRYNENIGKIQIRFKFDNQKAKNIKFKTSQTEINNGLSTKVTNPFNLDLEIKLNVQINANLVNKFINSPNVITGNTKYLKIDLSLEQAMIQEIIKENAINNSSFNDANLVVKYRLANQSDWKELNQFINDLKLSEKDQTSNEVIFKFTVTNGNDFQVDEKEWTLFDPSSEQNPDNWKVKLFINNGNWENNAANVSATGRSSSLVWNWNGLDVKEINGKVEGTGVQIQFSAKENPDYNEADVSDNEADLKSKWITIKPTKIESTIQNLWIRIKAKPGYIYGPAYNENGINSIAKVHKVTLNIKREILVDPKRLSRSLSMTGKPTSFVTDIDLAILNQFVQEGLDYIDPLLQKYVTVKFEFKNKKDLDVNGLYREISSIISTNNPADYGVL